MADRNAQPGNTSSFQSSYGNDWNETNSGTIFGSGTTPGLLGTGMYDPKKYNINQGAYYDTSGLDAQGQNAARLQAAAENRVAPTSQSVNVGQANQGQAVNATAANTGQANLATAQNMNAANVGTANLSDAANINRQDEQFRNAQLGLAGNLQNTIAGNGPSLAAGQIGQANAAAAASRMAANASQRGYGNSAATNRQAAYAQGAANQSAAMQSAQTRIQEQQAAQQALGNVLATGRQADIGVNTSQAQLAQQTSLANQEAQNQFQLQQAANQQQANIANQQFQNQFALANTGAQNQFQLQNTQNQQSVNELNANSQNQFGQLNMGANNQFQLQSAQNQQATNLANQEAYLRQQGLNDAQIQAMLGTQVGIVQQTLANKQAYEKAATDQNISLNQVQQQSYADAAKNRSGAIGGVLSAVGGLAMFSDENLKTNIRPITLDSITDSTKQIEADKKNKENLDQQNKLKSYYNNATNQSSLGSGLSNLIKGFASTGGSDSASAYSGSFAKDVAMSDQNQKEDILSGNSQVQQFLNTLNPVTYKYKDTSLPGTRPGNQLGIIAQDMEKSDLGSSFVNDTPNGKMVDYGKALPALTASVALLNKEVKKLKGKK